MKKPILAFLAGGLVMLALGAALPQQVYGRFQLRDAAGDILVVDTTTGETFVHGEEGWTSLGQPKR